MNERFHHLIVGIYAWLSAVMFGAVLFDRQYARSLQVSTANTQLNEIFAEISDTLLLLGLITIIFGLAASLLAWKHRATRNFLIASLFIYLFEFMGPMTIMRFVDIEGLSWLRLLPSGLASIFAAIGLYKSYQHP